MDHELPHSVGLLTSEEAYRVGRTQLQVFDQYPLSNTYRRRIGHGAYGVGMLWVGGIGQGLAPGQQLADHLRIIERVVSAAPVTGDRLLNNSFRATVILSV